MAKRIRFPLEMENDIEVRNLEELKDNFSLARVIGYINDGKLITWLQDRYENELAEEVKKICDQISKYDRNTINRILISALATNGLTVTEVTTIS